MTKNNKIILAMLIVMTSITTTAVYADVPQNPLILAMPQDHAVLVWAYQNASDSLPVLSHTVEYSYDGTFTDTVSETILTDPGLPDSERSFSKITITDLEAGHEYSFRMFMTNADGNSVLSDTVSTIPASASYTINTDIVTYVNGTALQEFGSVVYTNQILIFSGTLLRDGLPFGGELAGVEFFLDGKYLVMDTTTVNEDGTWSVDIPVNLPMTWDTTGDVFYHGIYTDEFGVEYRGGGAVIDYKYIIPEGSCPVGHTSEIIDEHGNFICNVTTEWHASEIEKLERIIDHKSKTIERLEHVIDRINKQGR
jgi:hypothetical protein